MHRCDTLSPEPMAIDLEQQQLRERIFELKANGYSLRQIMAELGVSMGKVQRELRKRADEVHAPEPPGPTWRPPAADAGMSTDPELREMQKAIALRRLRLQESRLGIEELEQERRRALLNGGGGSGGSDAMTAYLMGEMQRVRAELERRQSSGSAGLIDQLKELRDLGNTVALFAPPTGPTTATDVEFKLGLRRLDLEEQRILGQHEKELALRQKEVDSANMRNDALAKFIEGFGPVLQQLAVKWVDDRKPQPAAPGQPQLPGEPAAAQLASAEVEGHCPACQIGIAMLEGETQKCPGCGTVLACSAGQITIAAAGPAGDQPARRPVESVTY